MNKNVFIVLLGAVTSVSAFADDCRIYQAINKNAPWVTVTESTTPTTFVTSVSVGGLNCSSIVPNTPSPQGSNTSTCKCSLDLSGRDDLKIYSALDGVTANPTTTRPIPGGGPLAFKEIDALKCVLSGGVHRGGSWTSAECEIIPTSRIRNP